MNARLLAAAAVALVVACKQGPAASPIERLAWRCEPDDVARLVLIASSGASRELRCRAMSVIYGHHPLVSDPGDAARHTGIVAIQRREVREALTAMLADPEPWCFHARGTARPQDRMAYISPRQTAAIVLDDFPDPDFDVNLAPLVAEETAAGRGPQAQILKLAASSLWRARRFAVDPRAAFVDDMVTGGTPAAFERLVDFVAAGSPWDDGRQDLSDAQRRDIDLHIYSAIHWLSDMVLDLHLRPPEPRWGRLPVHELSDAVAHGALGKKIMDAFDEFGDGERTLLVGLIGLACPPGCREWLERVAQDDPDRDVRDTARRELSRAR
jgi:hypothetical protein